LIRADPGSKYPVQPFKELRGLVRPGKNTLNLASIEELPLDGEVLYMCTEHLGIFWHFNEAR
jgi:hypothetical protein